MEEKEKYAMTYTSFSGADSIPTLNGEAVGEIEKITYEEFLYPRFDQNGSPLPVIEGKVVLIVFDKESKLRSLMKGKDEELILFFANEYGQKFSIRYVGLQFKKRLGGVSVDDIMMNETYTFTADAVVHDATPWKYSLEDNKYSYIEERLLKC